MKDFEKYKKIIQDALDEVENEESGNIAPHKQTCKSGMLSEETLLEDNELTYDDFSEEFYLNMDEVDLIFNVLSRDSDTLLQNDLANDATDLELLNLIKKIISGISVKKLTDEIYYIKRSNTGLDFYTIALKNDEFYYISQKDLEEDKDLSTGKRIK